MRSSGVAPDWSSEDGSVVGSIAGVMIFLGFLLMAAQTTLHLYGTSVVTATAFDVARRVATDTMYSCELAEVDVLRELGDYGRRPGVDAKCDRDGDHIVMTVEGPSPARLVAGLGRAAGIDTLSRSVRVRHETFVGTS